MKNLWNKLLCLCCSKQWGMNHPTKSFVDWDEDMEEVYSTKITWGKNE
jgi:hypothetical protein